MLNLTILLVALAGLPPEHTSITWPSNEGVARLYIWGKTYCYAYHSEAHGEATILWQCLEPTEDLCPRVRLPARCRYNIEPQVILRSSGDQ